MSKDEKLRKNAGNNMAESVGVGVALGLPPGMAPEAALGRPAHLEGLTRAKNLVEIAVTQIVRDDKQPRVVFSEAEMDDLVQSVTARGVLQPIRVRWNTDLGKYVIVAGERRFRAARQAGLRAVPCVIHEGAMTESTILQDQLVENLLRQDLQPIETAKAYCRLMELEGWSARQLARELHVPDANIVRRWPSWSCPKPCSSRLLMAGSRRRWHTRSRSLIDPRIRPSWPSASSPRSSRATRPSRPSR